MCAPATRGLIVAGGPAAAQIYLLSGQAADNDELSAMTFIAAFSTPCGVRITSGSHCRCTRTSVLVRVCTLHWTHDFPNARAADQTRVVRIRGAGVRSRVRPGVHLSCRYAGSQAFVDCEPSRSTTPQPLYGHGLTALRWWQLVLANAPRFVRCRFWRRTGGEESGRILHVGWPSSKRCESQELDSALWIAVRDRSRPVLEVYLVFGM